MSKPAIYLHSTRADFADTKRLPEAAYLGRCLRPGPLKAFGCGCGSDGAKLVRIGRSPWMRLLPLFRLYQCLACGRRVLRTRMRQRVAYGIGVVYMPPAPLQPASMRYRHVLHLLGRREG